MSIQMKSKKSIRERLKRLKAKSGWSYERLAQEIGGVTFSTIRNYILGREPTNQLIQDHLEAKLSWLEERWNLDEE